MSDISVNSSDGPHEQSPQSSHPGFKLLQETLETERQLVDFKLTGKISPEEYKLAQDHLTKLRGIIKALFGNERDANISDPSGVSGTQDSSFHRDITDKSMNSKQMQHVFRSPRNQEALEAAMNGIHLAALNNRACFKNVYGSTYKDSFHQDLCESLKQDDIVAKVLRGYKAISSLPKFSSLFPDETTYESKERSIRGEFLKLKKADRNRIDDITGQAIKTLDLDVSPEEIESVADTVWLLGEHKYLAQTNKLALERKQKERDAVNEIISQGNSQNTQVQLEGELNRLQNWQKEFKAKDLKEFKKRAKWLYEWE